ncbi:TldD/PmbA family protein [bacterium]|nr:TldD/PmbA family protein [candidate division CSSED10-310 bacterium]
MERILELAKKKADQAEVFRIEKRSEPACFFGGKLTALETEEMLATGLRVVVNGKLGFSSTTHPDEGESLVLRALESAEFGPNADLEFPSAVRHFGAGKFYDPAVIDLSSEKQIEIGEEMIEIVQSSFPDVNLEVEVTKEAQRVSIMNSHGGDVSYERSLFQAFLNVLWILESDRAELEHTYTSIKLTNGPQQMAHDAVWRFNHCRRVAPIETKKMTVIFTSLGFRGLFVPLFYGFNGDLVARKLSLLSDKLNQHIVDPRIVLADDPTNERYPGSCPVDDEGVLTNKNILIDKGILKSFIFDLRSSHRLGLKSSGNGFKKSSLYTGFSVDAQPNPTPSTFVIEPGTISRDELIASVKEGIIVDDTMGAGQGNNLNGEFSMNVALGYKIENGQIVGRVKDVMVAGNVFEIFQHNLRNMTQETWPEDTLFGRYCVPWIAFDDMPVSAT